VSPKTRVKAATGLLIASVIGWPVSAFTFAAGEPPAILGLSWLAITLTALDILATQDVRKTQEPEKEP
jgi:hypothetical protein